MRPYKIKYLITFLTLFLVICFLLPSCKQGFRKAEAKAFQYKAFKDSINSIPYDTTGDANNIFDSSKFNPGHDSVNALLNDIDTIWTREYALSQVDTLLSKMKKGNSFTPEEMDAIKSNLAVLDSFLKHNADTSSMQCNEKTCSLYVEIIKPTQTLYLYVAGELVDSFKVSTGMKKYETPVMNKRPSGPLFTKYKSRKYPGGNYMGLGNMPYAVFIKGGYAIHGTTPGNFAKLGTKASHGCIRLHPVNARIFFELVKTIGLKNTWVSLKDSLPSK